MKRKIKHNGETYEMRFSWERDLVRNNERIVRVGGMAVEVAGGKPSIEPVVYMMFDPRERTMWVQRIDESEERKNLQRDGVIFKKVTSVEAIGSFIRKHQPQWITDGIFISKNSDSKAVWYGVKTFRSADEYD